MSYKLLSAVVVSGVLGFAAGTFSDSQSLPVADTDVATITDMTGSVTNAYICPMHAHITSDHEGDCPICGMELVLSERESDSVQASSERPVVSINSAIAHNMGVRTDRVKRGKLSRSIETIGKITRVDPMARRTITPPIRGELVYLADKTNGDIVSEGELLFSVISDELIEQEKGFQEAYLNGDRATATAMIPALRTMGLSPEQIADLQSGKLPKIPVHVYAFEEGYIYTRRGKLGEKVHTGFTVFNLGGNYQVIEVTAEIFERQWGWVETGQRATMSVRGLPGRNFEGKVVRVEPPVGYTTRSLEVALKFKTDNSELSQSMFAHVSIEGQIKENVLIVPTDSVIRTGSGNRVVVRDGDQYQPVEVSIGEESDGYIEIKSGLSEGEQVVSSGQFLIDSESSLYAGLRRMSTPGTSPVDVEETNDKQGDKKLAAGHMHNEATLEVNARD
jgi:Cu(I)/Ag(I) efflux system membrane fusion protein